ncbi:benzoate-CoA ligase family protein [Streptomyces sp. SID13726]|uniref:benzoate-CoA ligase family protein n=1 Tax=Streptomyces sp. SID13726 TaxID=2706058 RepID=UPI0013BDAC65|nr:benzoate-CoA ligase family protein [Streptomyces sp. SID13726]NEB03366.1 benzoate-CoA ligase family protein [Streptomyces sp. SID13726]
MPEVFNATDHLVDRHLREGNGSRTALVTPTRSLTYRELSDEVRRVAAGPTALGVRPEERVLMCMADDVELFTGILAAFRIGAVAVPASTMLTGGELGTLIADSRSRVVLGSAEFAPVVGAALQKAPEVEHAVLTGGGGPQLPFRVTGLSWPELLDAGADDSPYATWPDSPALWLYTSGTTGTPKAAMHRHVDIKVVAENYGRQVLGIGPEDRCLSVAKLFFAYGIGNSMFFPLAAGGTALLEPARPSPALFAERAAGDRATVLFGTPSFYGPLLAGAGIPDDAFGTVRLGVSAGEALPARMYHEVLRRFGVEVLDGIGSTEMLHVFVSNRAGRVHPGSSGEPVPGYAVELRDAEGGLVEGVGAPGELYVRGESAATGYWCRAGTTRQVFLGDWMRTGDTYVRNADGTYTCMGRTDDLLKAGGIWVSPAEVEERLLAHPDVAEAAVVGAPDADGLDKPVACVVARPGRAVDPGALVAWCREELAAFKRPRGVVALPELPRTPTGKIRRNVLRALVRDGSWAEPSPPLPTGRPPLVGEDARVPPAG